MDTPDSERSLLRRLVAAFPFLGEAAASEAPRAEVPWTQPKLPLREAVVALVTTGGVYLENDAPFDNVDPDGDPGYRVIPMDTPPQSLRITTDYYDHCDADTDINVVLPMQRLREFQHAGTLGALYPVAFSVMGHLGERRLQEFQIQTCLGIAGKLAAAGVHYALLVPA